MAAKIEDIGLEIENGKESIEMIEAKLPSQDDVAGILGQFTELAQNNHLSVPSFKPQPSVPASPDARVMTASCANEPPGPPYASGTSAPRRPASPALVQNARSTAPCVSQRS